MSAKCIGIYRPPFRVQSGGAIQFSPSPNRSAPQWSATRKVPLVDFWRKSWVDVAKSSSHHLSQTEIDGDNPCSQQLSRTSSCQVTVWQELAHFGLSNRAPFL